jgi:archaetidylinositol phosphate synthase
MSNPRPWDARVARWLVAPLQNTAIVPNHLTTVRLVTGLLGVWLLAIGSFNSGAALVTISNFLDHTDGELARITGKGSRFGHLYDLYSDALITCGMFVGLGLGVAATSGDRIAITLGAIAGIAVATIFHLRFVMEERHGKAATAQAAFAGFEVEDVLYLFPLVTIFGVESSFLRVAAIGAGIALIIVTVLFLRSRQVNPS